jgi:hypothetical protein
MINTKKQVLDRRAVRFSTVEDVLRDAELLVDAAGGVAGDLRHAALP